MPTPSPNPPAESPAPTSTGRPRSRRRSFWTGTAIALVLVAGLGWLAWHLTRPAQLAGGAAAGMRAGGPGGPGGPGGALGPRAATTVGVATAQAADIPVNLEALGTVVPLATVKVRPQVSGVLTRVLFKEGQSVRRDEVLATIDPRPFQLAVDQAKGQRMRDEASLAAARVILERYETLLKQDSIARQDVDTQRATVDQLAAAVVSDKAAEDTARLNLSYTRVTSPVDGRVGLRAVDPGNQVSSTDTTGIAVITQMTPMEVQFSIPQDHAAWLQQHGGASMPVRAWDRTRTTLLDTGAFASLDNQIDPTTGTVRAKARFRNAQLQLFPSQFVNVQLQVRTIHDAVVVPVAAVRQSAGGEFVFVLQADRTVKQRPVVRGQPMGERVQIASGLQVGEQVITEGADRLRDGSRVLLPGDFAAGGAGTAARHRGAASGPAAPASAAASSGQSWAGMTPEERAAAWARLSPEEREQLRQRRRQREAAAGAAQQ